MFGSSDVDLSLCSSVESVDTTDATNDLLCCLIAFFSCVLRLTGVDGLRGKRGLLGTASGADKVMGSVSRAFAGTAASCTGSFDQARRSVAA